MAIRNPAARNSAVIPTNITTRIVRRGKGFSRRAIYRDGRFIGYTVSFLGLHEAYDKDNNKILPPTEGHVGFPYLSDAVVAVGQAPVLCKGYGEECGNEIKGSSDLCPDCTTARLDVQSPRIPV
jgi:hypothetical protein